MASNDEKRPAGTSRRTALKAGVATGVGLVAWSSPSITSLGGTPAYALGCTFVQVFSLTGGCRNTTQQSGCTGPFSFQPLTAPAGFSWAQNVGSNVCCENGGNAILNIPNNLDCKAVFALFATPQRCSSQTNPTASNTTMSVGTQITIPLSCLGQTSVTSQSRYSITLTCNTSGAPPSCL